jgi:DNA-binding PadR family transcriptional regulator
MRYPILALLSQAPAHGYELKLALEQRFGSVLPPLNGGQIYTTLQRLERDGLVEGDRVAQSDRPNKRVYALTEAGRAELKEWIDTPAAGTRLKDEFFMKLMLAGPAGIAEPLALIDRQRRAYLQALRDLDGLLADGAANGDARLLVEGAALHLEADLRWLALCEERLTREVNGGSHPGS